MRGNPCRLCFRSGYGDIADCQAFHHGLSGYQSGKCGSSVLVSRHIFEDNAWREFYDIAAGETAALGKFNQSSANIVAAIRADRVDTRSAQSSVWQRQRECFADALLRR